MFRPVFHPSSGAHNTVSTVSGINPLTPNDPYRGRAAPLTSKRCILYIYSTNIGTEYFKHGTYSPFFSLQNAVCFIILTYLVPVLLTYYIQGVLKLKKNNFGAKRLMRPVLVLVLNVAGRDSSRPAPDDWWNITRNMLSRWHIQLNCIPLHLVG